MAGIRVDHEPVPGLKAGYLAPGLKSGRSLITVIAIRNHFMANES